MSVINIAVNAAVNDDGHVVADVACNGQKAKLTFTGSDIIFDVPEPGAGA
jgi:hypothetical protein